MTEKREFTPLVPSRMTRSNTGQAIDAEWEGYVRGWNACIDQMEYNQTVHSERGRGEAALKWAVATFGEVAEDKQERAMRFIEEAIELANAVGLEKRFISAILFRVYDRQKGDRSRELGQAMLTLELLAEVFAIDPQRAAAHEFERIQSIPKEEWERRHKAKVEMGIAK